MAHPYTYYTHICRVVQKYWNTLETVWPVTLLLKCFVPEYFKLPCYRHTSTGHLYDATHIPSVVYFYSNTLDEHQKQPLFILVFKIYKFLSGVSYTAIVYRHLQKRTHECEVQRMRQPTNRSITYDWSTDFHVTATTAGHNKAFVHSRKEYLVGDP
jgi:hypothetical protein